jgi:hypothetical protein
MQDEPPATGTTEEQPQTARARSPWVLRYKFPQLNLPSPREWELKLTQEETTWSLRGQPRTRQMFADPHPLDFRGGLARPREYPLA